MTVSVSTKLKKFFSGFESKNVLKNTILLTPNQDSKKTYLLESGIVRMYSIHDNGEEATMLLFKPFSFFPTVPILFDKPNEYYFQAVTNVTYSLAPKEHVKEFIQKNPDISYDLLTRVFRGMDGLFKQIEFMHTGSAYQKLIQMLIISHERFTVMKDKKKTLPFTHELIGSIIGSKRETVSRQLKKLKDKNIISLSPSSIAILDSNRLKGELSSKN